MSRSEEGSRSELVRANLEELASLARRCGDELAEAVAEVAEVAAAAIQGGGTLYFCGNGGSAADAQHLAAEYVVRFARDRAPIPAVALTTDTSVLTAAGNDYSFQEIFSRQVVAHARSGDVLFLHSTSGESKNLLRAAEVARSQGVHTVALLAKGGGSLRELVDHALVVATESTARAQEVHLAIGHAICELVEGKLTEEPG